MPTRTKDHFLPAPLSAVSQRKLVARWVQYNADVYGKSQKELVEDMNQAFGAKMRPWQIIRWRAPTNEIDEDRTIHIDFVEYMAEHGGIHKIFSTHGVSEDEKLLGKSARIWYHPQELVKASIQRVVKERMINEVDKPADLRRTTAAVVSIHQYVAEYLEILLETLDISYNRKALTKKVKQEIADEIYSIVGFDFNPLR